MKKFWGVVVILLLLLLGYQFMKSTQLNPSNVDITWAVQHYVSDALWVEFDYLDHIDNYEATAVESGKVILVGWPEVWLQSMEVLSHDPAQTLDAFLKKLLTWTDKRCSFEFKTWTFLTDIHAQQLTVVNKSPRKYLGLGTGDTGGPESTLCKSIYDNQDALKFFALDSRTPDVVYFFTIGEESNIMWTTDLRTPRYQTLKFLATGDIVSANGIGPITDDATGHMNLIRTYYNAIQTHDFVTAGSLVASGEKDAVALQSTYAKVLELSPFKIEQLGDNLYQFYVRFLDAWATQPSIYSLRKTVIDGKLKSIAWGKIVTNTSNDHFRYYSDEFISMSPKTFKVLDFLTAQDLVKSDCTRPATKDLAYFKKLLSVFTAQDTWTKYTVSFKDPTNVREAPPGGIVGKQSANVYVIPNKIKYPAKEAFFEDFNKCYASSKYVPFLITIDSMIFVDGCGKWDKWYCSDIANMLKQTIKVK